MIRYNYLAYSLLQQVIAGNFGSPLCIPLCGTMLFQGAAPADLSKLSEEDFICKSQCRVPIMIDINPHQYLTPSPYCPALTHISRAHTHQYNSVY
uniref:Uncharacterized protein n=1 Tax=Anguilla anguilla TaxID=7936 RepID=A0A0E9Q0P8_ANGAN